jgi:hypothetical protein
MRALGTNDLALLAKTDRVATDILLARFEKGVDSPERRQLVAFVTKTRGFGAHNLYSDDFVQEMRIKTWEAIGMWNPAKAAFTTYLQATPWRNVSHFLRSERRYASRHVAETVGDDRATANQPSPAEVEAEKRWCEATQDRDEEDVNTEMNELLLDVRAMLVLGLVKNPDQKAGVRQLLVAAAHLGDGVEVQDFAASLDERREQVTTELGRAMHPGTVQRPQASRWLSQARAEMAKEAHRLGLNEGLVRVALGVPGDDAWQRVKADAQLVGVVVEGVTGRAA